VTILKTHSRPAESPEKRLRPRSGGSVPTFCASRPAPPMLLGLRTTIYVVPDLAAARDWYAAAFSIAPYFDEAFYVGFEVGGFELGLMPTEGRTAQPGPGGTLAYWGVADLPAAHAALLEKGAREVVAPNDVGGGIAVSHVADPWGNTVGLIHNPHFDPAKVR